MESDVFFVGNVVVAIGIFVYLIFNFIKHHKDERVKHIIFYFILIAGLYFIIGFFSFSWFFDIFGYVELDYLFILALIYLLQSLFLFMVVYHVSKNKKFVYLAISYVLIFFLVFLLGVNFMNYFIIASFLFLLLLFIGLIFREPGFKESGWWGVTYSVVSIILHFLFFFDVSCLCLFNFISNVLFFIFVYYFLKNLEESPPEPLVKKEKGKHYFLIFLSHFIFMIVLINFVFIGTVVLHEFGHLSVGGFYGCEYGKIVYESGFPRTEILCGENVSNMNMIIASALLLPIIVGIVLIFVGGRFLREIALLMIGFNLVISSRDLSDMGFAQNLIVFFVILGVFIAVAGIIYLARSKTEEYIYSISQI